MKPTIEKIAEICNVSKSTVSRVLNNNPRISENTKKRVLEVAQKLHYFDGESAESLGKVCLFLVANPHDSVEQDEFFSSVFKGISFGCKRLGYHCMVETVKKNEMPNENLFSLPSIKGVIVGGIPLSAETTSFLSSCNLPIVQIGKYKNLENHPSINNDNYRGGFLVGETVAKSKFKKVFIVTGPLEVDTFKDRVSGFEKAIRDSGENTELKIIESEEFDEKSGFEAAGKILSSYEKNEGTIIFCTTDWIAKGILERCKLLNIKIPEEVSLIGFGNLKFTEFLTPSLSSVSLNPYLLGRFAVTALSDIVDGAENISGTVFIEPSLILRDSIEIRGDNND